MSEENEGEDCRSTVADWDYSSARTWLIYEVICFDAVGKTLHTSANVLRQQSTDSET